MSTIDNMFLGDDAAESSPVETNHAPPRSDASSSSSSSTRESADQDSPSAESADESDSAEDGDSPNGSSDKPADRTSIDSWVTYPVIRRSLAIARRLWLEHKEGKGSNPDGDDEAPARNFTVRRLAACREATKKLMAEHMVRYHLWIIALTNGGKKCATERIAHLAACAVSGTLFGCTPFDFVKKDLGGVTDLVNMLEGHGETEIDIHGAVQRFRTAQQPGTPSRGRSRSSPSEAAVDDEAAVKRPSAPRSRSRVRAPVSRANGGGDDRRGSLARKPARSPSTKNDAAPAPSARTRKPVPPSSDDEEEEEVRPKAKARKPAPPSSDEEDVKPKSKAKARKPAPPSSDEEDEGEEVVRPKAKARPRKQAPPSDGEEEEVRPKAKAKARKPAPPSSDEEEEDDEEEEEERVPRKRVAPDDSRPAKRPAVRRVISTIAPRASGTSRAPAYDHDLFFE